MRELGNVGWRNPENPFGKNICHYFINGRSLCKKFQIEYWVGNYKDNNKHCKICEKKKNLVEGNKYVTLEH